MFPGSMHKDRDILQRSQDAYLSQVLSIKHEACQGLNMIKTQIRYLTNIFYFTSSQLPDCM